MFRIDDDRRARFARVALPLGLSVVLTGLAGIALVVLLHVREKRAIVTEALAGRSSPDDALREIAPILGSDVVLLGAALILAIAVALAIAAGYRAYSQAERRLAELKAFSADVLESVATGVVTLDLEGRVTAINGRAAALLGVDPRRTRVPFNEVFASAPILCDAAERLVRRRAPFRNLEVAALASDGGRTLSLDGSFLETHAGERIGAVIQIADVTEQRAIEREVRRSEQLAALGTLAAGVAHEIRNPLAALDINVQLLGEAVASARSPAETTRYVRVIETELHRLDGIVENFIRFARSTPLERAAVDLAKLVEETLALVAPECRKQRVRIERRGLDAPHPPVLATEGGLKQALLNVVLNAIQAMPGGGTLTLSLEHGAAQARISVHDTGPGIPPRIRERVFDLFFTTREGGTGLGLPIAKKILTAHGGDLTFETGEDGTTFTLALPIQPAPEHAPAGRREASPAPRPGKEGRAC